RRPSARRARHPRRRPRRLRSVRVAGRRAPRGDGADRRRQRPQAGQGPGADPRRGHGTDSGPAAVPVARGARARTDAPAPPGRPRPPRARAWMIRPFRLAVTAIGGLAVIGLVYFAITL